jgi:hypothetical protein
MATASVEYSLPVEQRLTGIPGIEGNLRLTLILQAGTTP